MADNRITVLESELEHILCKKCSPQTGQEHLKDQIEHPNATEQTSHLFLEGNAPDSPLFKNNFDSPPRLFNSTMINEKTVDHMIQEAPASSLHDHVTFSKEMVGPDGIKVWFQLILKVRLRAWNPHRQSVLKNHNFLHTIIQIKSNLSQQIPLMSAQIVYKVPI